MHPVKPGLPFALPDAVAPRWRHFRRDLKLAVLMTDDAALVAAFATVSVLAVIIFRVALALGLASGGNVVVTLGDEGVQVAGEHIVAYPATPVDATGAGDAFVGALAVALAEGADLLVPGRYAPRTTPAEESTILVDGYTVTLDGGLHERFDRRLAPAVEHPAVEAAGEASHPGEADALDLHTVTVEHANAAFFQDLHQFLDVAGLVVVVAEDGEDRDAQVHLQVVHDVASLLGCAVVRQVAAEQQHVGGFGDLPPEVVVLAASMLVVVDVAQGGDAKGGRFHRDAMLDATSVRVKVPARGESVSDQEVQDQEEHDQSDDYASPKRLLDRQPGNRPHPSRRQDRDPRPILPHPTLPLGRGRANPS